MLLLLLLLGAAAAAAAGGGGTSSTGSSSSTSSSSSSWMMMMMMMMEEYWSGTWAAVALALGAAYMAWFWRLARGLRGGPRVWPVVGSLPGLVQNAERMHEWIAGNLRGAGGTYQTCICAVPGLARRAGLVTVTCDPRNLEHVLKSRFDNYPKGPTWHAVFRDLLGDGIFNSDGDTWLLQRKTAALEFTTRTLRHAMSRWVARSIHLRLLPILSHAADARSPNAFAVAFDRATEATLQRFIFPEFVWQFKKRLQFGMEATLASSVAHVDRYLSAVIKARKLELVSSSSPSPSPSPDRHDDLLSRFMKKGSYSDDFLQQVALNFILAGRDTSSVALSWFFWLVSTHPPVERRILLELASVLADSRADSADSPPAAAWLASPLAFEEVDRLVYLKAALSRLSASTPPSPRTPSTSSPTTSSPTAPSSPPAPPSPTPSTPPAA
uniref:Uncharacterized protein n=1 Tax=Ananas comosus var. bracteatus TaxID=296719 RepID=A0A6V7QNT5_ANACO|nr:unnamed protein product [Ananas comosus var. bracteatus]